MELQTIGGREIYNCFICGHQEPAVLVRDSQRWWGNFHLPLIDIFINPAAAFRQLSGHPVIGVSLVFYILAGGVQWHFVHHRYDAALQKIVNLIPSWSKGDALCIFIVLLGILLVTLQAATLHVAAKALGPPESRAGRAAFSEIWSTIFFLGAVYGLITMIPGISRPFMWGLAVFHWIWTIWAIQIIYGFDVLPCIGTWVLSWFFCAVVVIGVGLLVAFPLMMRLGLSPHYGRKMTLHEMHRPADYAWQVKTLEGKSVSMGDLKGKVVFLNFWATWCFPCRMEMGSIQRLYDHFKDNPNIVFLCVSEESADVVRKFWGKTHYTFPVYVTDGEKPPAAYSTYAIPVTYILSPQGQIVAEHTGAGQWDSSDSIRFLEGLTQPNRKKA